MGISRSSDIVSVISPSWLGGGASGIELVLRELPVVGWRMRRVNGGRWLRPRGRRGDPENPLYTNAIEDAQKNRLRVLRQVPFDTKGTDTLDLVLTVNGIPV